MKTNEKIDSLYPAALEKVRPYAKDADTGFGTKFVDAAAYLLSIYAVKTSTAKCKPNHIVNNISVSKIVEITTSLYSVMYDDEFEKEYEIDNLETGKTIKLEPGPAHMEGVRVDGFFYYQLRNIPGLHSAKIYRSKIDPTKPGFKLLCDKILEEAKNFKSLGIPEIKPSEIGFSEYSSYRQALMVPMRVGPDKISQEPLWVYNTETMSDEKISSHAKSIVKEIRQTWAMKDMVDDEYHQARQKISKYIDEAQREGYIFDFIGIKVTERSLGHMGFKTDKKAIFKILSNDLVEDRWAVYEIGNIEKSVKSQMTIQRKREKQKKLLGENSCRGNIDSVTIKALAEFGLDLKEVLKTMSTKTHASFKTGRKDRKLCKIRLAWKDGNVRSSFNITDNVSWSYDCINVTNLSIPETVLTTLAGRKVTDLIESPLIDRNLTIKRVKKNRYQSTFLSFTLDMQYYNFDENTGGLINV